MELKDDIEKKNKLPYFVLIDTLVLQSFHGWYVS